MKDEKRIYTEPHPDEPVERLIMEPGPEDEVTDRYDQVDTAGFAGIPLFRVVHAPRHPMQTDAQDLVSRRDLEQYYLDLSALRHLAHRAANELGFPARCARPACRRAHACVSDRDENDWSFPGPWMPPCAGTYRLVDRIRGHMRAKAGLVNGDGDA
ncbi:hypothetical protein [Aquamicrobium sp. LC103]|uniref:hypothetical protein n=1 Tax=Aquamicrobium sp. LC103 TaxID=1120658 RepID=UPI00063EC362|nr:hypothetical protein [Aquamicrobium sp. LC103]TKT74864.1 hypothetical protein XW59_020490 [Aquamicrobium sp. LC103]